MVRVGGLSFKVLNNMVFIKQYTGIDNDIPCKFGSFYLGSLTFEVNDESVSFKIGDGENPSRGFKNTDEYSALQFATKLFDAIIEEQERNSIRIQ
jgi:hypothetical protein